ncbi:hypothetical protein IV203_011612 [Nitzschia inconspicua]|uniref:Uncharacterized protein n=1 Tax=Nitzschia inconspicua TaxID=303405 RepID=A0A9K3PJ13_9STRA|nr:hypothetical protein IV203_011612 [Nitzschia inconspicua]
MVKRRSRISYENTTKTTTKQRKSNTSTPAIRSTERTVTKRFYAASFPKRPPARWINTETKILFQHLDSILNNENWEETLGLLPNCTKGDITQRTMV